MKEQHEGALTLPCIVRKHPRFPHTYTLVLDAVPTVNSFNGVTSDGVARAIAGGGNVPAPGEGDDGKVLTVVDGTAAWAEPQGGSSYTAGDGIAIENDEIKVRVKDGNPLKITTQQQSGSYASIVTPEGTPSSEGWKAMNPDTYYITCEYDEAHDTTVIGFSYLWFDGLLNTLAMSSLSEDSTKNFDAKLHLLWISSRGEGTDIVATSDTLSDAFTAGWDTEHIAYTYSLGSLVDTTDEGRVFHVDFYVPGDHRGDWNSLAFSSSGSDYSGIDNTVQSSFLSESHVLTLPYEDVYIVGETTPGGDLYVDVDQTYNGYSSRPQSGTAVAEAISQSIPPMPEVKGNGAMVGHRGYSAGQITEDPSTFTLSYTNSGDDADNQFQLQEYITSNSRVCTLYGRFTLNGQESATNGADTTGTVTVTTTDSNTVTFPIKLRQYAYQYTDYGSNKTQVSFTSEPFCLPLENCWTNSESGSYDYVSSISVNIAGTNSGSETLDKARLDIVASWTDGNIPK